MPSDQSASGTYRFGHFFADLSAEAEVLAAHGDVYRATLEPRKAPHVDETEQMDLMEATPDVQVKLGILHPVCSRWAETTTVSGDPEDHPNMIPRARDIARECCEYYVIENVPRAPLEDATVLSGKMFGLPIEYERAFEANFSIAAPPRFGDLGTEVSTYFYSDRSADWWRSVKGYSGDYPKEHLAKNCLPSAYVQTIVRSWLKAVNERDAAPAQDNNSPAPPKISDDQATIPEVGR